MTTRPTTSSVRTALAPSRRTNPRRGSVLVVVLALLGALMLLGFLFYTIASQERENARYFSASKKFYSAGLSPDELFDFALEQIITGPQDDYANSALWGGRHSLLASMFGNDLVPYNGAGVNVINGAGNVPLVDQGYDGTGDTPPNSTGSDSYIGDDHLVLDMAGFTAATNTNPVTFPAPDVGYSYPDINSPFLAYVGVEPVTGNKVVIPSFHRPQYLRGLFSGAIPGYSVAADQWYINDKTLPYVLRPHKARELRTYNAGAVANVTATKRFHDDFFNDATISQDGAAKPDTLQENFWTWDGTGTPPVAARDASAAANGTAFDADPDGDGLAEAVWLDLDYPVDESADGTTTFIPLFAVTIYDLDGLLNLNAHGNLYGDVALASSIFGGAAGTATKPPIFGNLSGAAPVSRANEGRRRQEANLGWGFSADPNQTNTKHPDYIQNSGLALGPVNAFFGHAPKTPEELSNMELWFTLVGRADYDSSGKATPLYPGRWGEAERLETALNAGSTNPADYPRPGQTGSDVEITGSDGNRGLAFADVVGTLFPSGVIFLAPVHPADVHGAGTATTGNGKTPLAEQLITNMNPLTGSVLGSLRIKVPLYQGQWVPSVGAGYYIGPTWAVLQVANNFTPGLIALANYGLHDASGRFVDDPGETALDPELARDQATDSIFGADETAYLHMAPADLSANAITSRVMKLAPANLGESSPDRRGRFTTFSTDLTSYTAASQRLRGGEYTLADASNPDSGVFPPVFTTNDPFRSEVRGLLQNRNYTNDAVKGLLRKLSANHVAAGYQARDGITRYVLRPLTPHPLSGLTNVALDAATHPELAGYPPRFGQPDTSLPTTQSISTAAQQEWHARRDRQNLARDIYTLLWVLGNPTTGGVSATYTPAQKREMAQFAVNMVDAADPDDSITAFVYDLDLANGYTETDDGYTNRALFADGDDPKLNIPAGTDEDEDGNLFNDWIGTFTDSSGTTHNAGIVFGVEAQQLAFSEALAVFAKKVQAGASDKDHDATEWDDMKHRDFLYLELQNVTPRTVPLNGGWSIVCEPTFSAISPDPIGVGKKWRSLTIDDGGTFQVTPGGLFTIGVAGDGHNTKRADPADPRPPFPTDPLQSFIKVDPATGATSTAMGLPPYQRIAPYAAPLSFDGILQSQTPAGDTKFHVNDYDPSKPWTDGAEFKSDGTVSDSQTFPNQADTGNGATTFPKGGAWLELGDQTNRDSFVSGSVTFVLRRRLNLNRDLPDQNGSAADVTKQNDNPWVEVDRINVPMRLFDLDGNGDATDTQKKLDGTGGIGGSAGLKSQERAEPLRNLDADAPAVAAHVYNSLSNSATTGYSSNVTNGGTSASFGLWQRHFDRPFASAADLLTVPLYGPENLTRYIVSSIPVQDARQTAAVNFLYPDRDFRPLLLPITPPQVDLVQVWPNGNLWYRLFEFVEVPQKYGVNDGLEWFAHYGGPSPWLGDSSNATPAYSEVPMLREFGRINLNMVRHPHVLGGLLDDTRVMGLGQAVLPAPQMAASGVNGLTSQNAETWFGGGTQRDWWTALLASRDGLDPVTNAAILPGLPSSTPFRDFGAGVKQGIGGLSDTLMRPLPGDVVNQIGRRSLFELGDEGGALGGDADISTRYRLLGKVLNHGTTRTNSYVAFIQVNFFKAVGVDVDGDGADDAYQIGEKLTTSPNYRGTFVIDRALALELIQQKDLPGQGLYATGGTYSFAREYGPDRRPRPTFDWKQLIRSRRVIEDK